MGTRNAHIAPLWRSQAIKYDTKNEAQLYTDFEKLIKKDPEEKSL